MPRYTPTHAHTSSLLGCPTLSFLSVALSAVLHFLTHTHTLQGIPEAPRFCDGSSPTPPHHTQQLTPQVQPCTHTRVHTHSCTHPPRRCATAQPKSATEPLIRSADRPAQLIHPGLPSLQLLSSSQGGVLARMLACGLGSLSLSQVHLMRGH